MSEFYDPPPFDQYPDPGYENPQYDPPRSLPRPIAWMAIAILTLLVVALTVAEQYATPPTPDPTSANIVIELQTRVMGGLYATPPTVAKPPVEVQMAPIREAASTPGDHWRIAAVEVTFATDRDSAANRWEQEFSSIEKELILEEHKAIHATLIRALHDPASLQADERDLLRDELGWAGDLLVAGEDRSDPLWQSSRNRALQSLVVVMVAIFGAIILGLVGLVLLIFAIIAFRNPYNKWNLIGIPTTKDSGIYLESFTAYLAMMVIVPLVVFALIAAMRTTAMSTAEQMLAGLTALAVVSILGVIWPVLRGRSWSTVRHDIGLHSGRGLMREFGSGIVGYITILPIFAIGVIGTFILAVLYSIVDQLIRGVGSPPPPTGGHPVFDALSNAGPGTILLLLFLAAVFAPLFEETMFRGMFLSGCIRKPGLIAGLFLTSIVFAAIHPQGIVAIPALASLGFGFGLIRLWRGSLIAPMVAHGIHNGTLVLIVVLAIG